VIIIWVAVDIFTWKTEMVDLRINFFDFKIDVRKTNKFNFRFPGSNIVRIRYFDRSNRTSNIKLNRAFVLPEAIVCFAAIKIVIADGIDIASNSR